MNIKIQGGGSGTYANTGSKIKPERCEVLCDHGKPFQPGAGENGQDREGTG